MLWREPEREIELCALTMDSELMYLHKKEAKITSAFSVRICA